MVYLPVFLCEISGLLTRNNGQRELDALNLQLAVCREVEEEVVEQFVSSFRHRRLCDDFLYRVSHSACVCRHNGISICIRCAFSGAR